MACPVDNTTGAMACPALPITKNENYRSDVVETIDHSKLLPIPIPPHHRYYGMLGHAPDLDPILPVRSYWQLMDKYSPIYQLDLNMTYPRVFVGSRELVNEMADDDRFTKFTHRLHQEMRPVFGDGLFSAESTDKAWWKAHRLLVPAFGPIGLSRMFDDMQDISAQLVLKWDRFGPEIEIECIEDMSRLTFDTIGLCAFGYRFNEFYSDEVHPFMKQLKESIVESGRRANRPDLVNHFYYRDEAHRQENIVKMRALCMKIIQDRTDNPKPDARDLLNVMLNGIDKETGEKLGVDNVIFQIPTLLGGGYETTSSTLCFIYYFLCENPEALKKAQQEVDEIVGENILTYDMLRKLKYLDACMKEALRMQHPVSLLTRFSTRDTVVGGKYFIKKGQMISGIWRHFHRDPKIWGPDPDVFRPERMLDAEFSKVPPNSWKPFGDGLRACIGRGFAEQEILINMAMILQKFDISKVDPNYHLHLTGQMGVKPVNFKIRAVRREGRDALCGIPGGVAFREQLKAHAKDTNMLPEAVSDIPEIIRPLSVFFGGNMGTSESLVEALARSAPDFGLEVDDIRELDDAVENLPTDRPIIIIAASYEGRPSDNAKKFVQWLEDLAAKGGKLKPGVKYAIFGVGNSDWTHTYHKVPLLIDEKMRQLGAERFIEPGFANVKRDLIGPWEVWSEKLCLGASGTDKTERVERIGVEVAIERNFMHTLHISQAHGHEKMETGVVLSNRLLADSAIGAAKRHVDVRLPAGVEYRAGDYLVVQGRNPEEIVFRVMKRFGLSPEDVMTVKDSKKEFLPAEATAVEHFLRCNVELAAPITKRQLEILASFAEEGSAERNELDKLHDDATYQRILDERYSVIDVLEEVSRLPLPFGVYIDLLIPLTPRTYSISSSPLEPKNKAGDCSVVAVTFDVIEGPATSGHGTFRGVTSSYLANRTPGDNISCIVRPTNVPFRLPENSETPVVMFAAGSGIAPMRAFLQERAAIQRKGAKLGPALLFFGCRHADHDFLYRSELQSWESEGVVEVIPCFSKPDYGQRGRYVPAAVWDNRERVWEMFENGAHIYTCGGAAKVGRTSVEMWRKIWMQKTGKTEAEAYEWLDKAKNDRYVSDVY